MATISPLLRDGTNFFLIQTYGSSNLYRGIDADARCTSIKRRHFTALLTPSDRWHLNAPINYCKKSLRCDGGVSSTSGCGSRIERFKLWLIYVSDPIAPPPSLILLLRCCLICRAALSSCRTSTSLHLVTLLLLSRAAGVYVLRSCTANSHPPKAPPVVVPLLV